MASFTFNPLQQTQLQLLSFTHCKYSSTLNTFKFHKLLNFLPTKHTFNQRFLEAGAHVAHLEEEVPSATHQNGSKKTINHKASEDAYSGISSSSPTNRRVGRSSLKSNLGVAVEEIFEKRVILKDRHAKTRLSPKNRGEMGLQLSSKKFKHKNIAKHAKKTHGCEKGTAKIERKSDKHHVNQLEVERVGRGSKKSKADPPVSTLRVGLDMCSKRGDVIGAIRLYDLARKEAIKLGQYHYAVLLYLCSSAATGVVQPAKSGSGNRSFSRMGLSKEISSDDKEELNFNGFPAEVGYVSSGNFSKKSPITFSNGSMNPYPQSLDEMIHLMRSNADFAKIKDVMEEQNGSGIQVSEDVMRYALKRGFEIYNNMLLEKVPMNEATFTSVARMAMSLGDGNMAFDIVKKMKELGINPRLRSYGPALSVFCNNGDIEKAFTVEQHMLEHGVYPEEPELEALLRVSVESGRGDKVYYLLHKIRTSVRQVSPSTADLIEKWFKSKVASRVGKRKWDQRLITEAMENGGGGWHGQGWLGKGRWTVSRTSVGSNGLCKFCGEKLATIDLDPVETENFARSVASIAIQREKNSNFEKFQVRYVA